MKSRLTLIFAALVMLLGGMIWIMQDRPTIAAAPATTPPTSSQAIPMRVMTGAEQPIVPTSGPTLVPVTVIAAPVIETKSSPMVHVGESGEVQYMARTGDTVSQLAVALLGSDSKENRDAVIAANPSLQSNPDRVLEGQTYSIGAVTSAAIVPAADTKVETPPAPKLKYIAQPGDTVRGLAANLLGGDNKTNRETIIAGNASLRQDPDHLVAGKSYTIAAPNGLSADPHASQAKAPTSQPDADDVVKLSMGRTLRYTAQPGDTVSKLAVALLGTDTSENRDLIVKSNASLKLDPDHLVAGRVYWIAAPTP